MDVDKRPVVVLLVGATAVGKTEISLELANRLNAEIVSADSRLFYRGMDIGTAKPTRQQRARVPHHLVDIADPNQIVSLAAFQHAAHEAIRDILSRSRLPFLVGGTGQYVRAVTAGWRPPHVPPQPRLRAELERMARERGGQWLHDRLRRLDYRAAAVIDARNARRTMRALEVIMTTGRPFSEQRSHDKADYQFITVGLRRSREELYARIDARIDEMWRQGLLKETQHLLDQGYGPEDPAMSAIGYGQCIKVIQGAMDPEQAKAEMRRATRAFVRRQSNWFKESDPDIMWFEARQQSLVDAMDSFIRKAMSIRTVQN